MESLFEFLLEIYWRNVAQSVQHDLRKDTYNHLQDLELAYFEDKSTGGLLSVVNDDINQLERFLDTGANDLDPGHGDGPPDRRDVRLPGPRTYPGWLCSPCP
jgi:ABC-type multidrug transport system fused ATPase/permease subunit